MSLSGVSLNAVTATGVGTVIAFDKPRSPISMQVNLTGNPASVNVNLEISLDGVTFYNMFGLSNAGFAGTTQVALYARANLTTLTGGTSPTVTATIAAVD